MHESLAKLNAQLNRTPFEDFAAVYNKAAAEVEWCEKKEKIGKIFKHAFGHSYGYQKKCDKSEETKKCEVVEECDSKCWVLPACK